MFAVRLDRHARLPTLHRHPAPGRSPAGLAKLYREEVGFAWMPPEQLHLTLRFLGDVDDERLDSLSDALARIRIAPFFLPLEGVGGFPPRGMPKVIWVGVGRGHPLLFQLRQRLDDTLLALGIDADIRNFHPHVTLARLGPTAVPVAAAHYLKRHRDFLGPALHVEGFALYRSELHPAGAVHTLVRDFRF